MFLEPSACTAQAQEDDMSQAALKPKTQGPFDSLMEITSRPDVVFVEGRGS